jgi:cytoskeletal protein CcmA (bactofilin family)
MQVFSWKKIVANRGYGRRTDAVYISPAMSLISRKNDDPSTNRRPEQANTLGPEVTIMGTLKVRESLYFNAAIEGKIISGSQLVVGENANISGDISAEVVTLRGRVRGNVSVTGRAELKAGGELRGDLSAGRVEMEEGFTFVGQALIGPGKKQAPSARKA